MHCWDALWEVEGARTDLQSLSIPLLLMCGKEDDYFENVSALARATGIDLMTLPGDHNSAVLAVADRLDDLFAFWANA